MNHQHFKSWMLSDEPLSPEQSKALQAHLATCESCESLASGWLEVKAILSNASPVQPADKFVDRWQVRIDTQSKTIANRKQRQSWWFFMIAAGVALFLFFLMIVQILASFESPMEIFLSGLYLFTGVIQSITTLQGLVIGLLKTLVEIIPPSWWILLSVATSGLVLIWLVSLRKVIYPKRVTQ